jgi:hypothetical protein
LGDFRTGRGFRRAVCIFLGQLFALQMLLAVVIATQMAVAANGLAVEICGTGGAHSENGVDSKVRLKSASCAICALASFSAPPLQLSAAPIPGLVLDIVCGSCHSESIATADRFDPRCSQGPPQAA